MTASAERTILIVDDTTENIQLLSEVLAPEYPHACRDQR